MEFKSVSDWRAGPGLCRCCLSDGCYKDISNEYFWKGDKEVYADMLLDCFDLTISYQECGPNSNSRLICEVCIQRLRDAFSFKKQVVSSERRFSDYVKALASGEKPDLASFHEVKVELIKGEKAPSEPAEDDDMHNDLFDNLDDDDDDDADNQPLKNFASQLPKVESDTMQDIPAFDEDLIKKEAKVVKRKYTKKATSTSSKKAKPTTDDPEASSSKIKMDKKKGPQEPDTSTKWKLSLSQKLNASTMIQFSNSIPFTFYQKNNYFGCFYCQRQFNNIEEMFLHTKSHTKPQRSKILTQLSKYIKIDITDLKCIICDESITELEDLMEHLEMEHGKTFAKGWSAGIMVFKLQNKKEFNCHICDENERNFNLLSRHMNSHYNKYPCKDCSMCFNSELRLHKHKHSVHENKLVCGICKMPFNSAVMRTRHAARMHSNNELLCLCCTEVFTNIDAKNKHVAEMHVRIDKAPTAVKVPDRIVKEKPRSIVSPLKPSFYDNNTTQRLTASTIIECSNAKPFVYHSGDYQCFYCNTRFKEIIPLLEHTVTHKKPPVSEILRCVIMKRIPQNLLKIEISDLKCELCAQNLTDIDDLKDHLTKYHKKTFSADGDGVITFKLAQEGIFTCHKCNKTFPSFFPLNSHMNTHFENSVCETCGRGFPSEARLRSHRQIHENAKHPCDVCEKVFPSIAKLTYHKQRVHEKKMQKRLKCPYCNERFREHYVKLTHMREMHNKTFTFECESCKSTYSTRLSLRRHILKEHLRKIKCDYCDRSFSSNRELTDHIVTHTGERNHLCKICGQAYARAKNLRQHMKIHNRSAWPNQAIYP